MQSNLCWKILESNLPTQRLLLVTHAIHERARSSVETYVVEQKEEDHDKVHTAFTDAKILIISPGKARTFNLLMCNQARCG
jgi:hypothetical protein